MEVEYQNSVLPNCHDVDDRQPQNFIELGEQFLPPGNVPEEAVYRSALDRPCIQKLGNLIVPRLGFFVPLHIAVVSIFPARASIIMRWKFSRFFVLKPLIFHTITFSGSFPKRC